MTKYNRSPLAMSVEAAKALSDPGRVRILMALRNRELCLCQLIELLGLAPSTVSKHMTVLRQAGFVQSRKKGRWVYCRLTGEESSPEAVAQALAWIAASAEDAPELREDEDRLKHIANIDPESLCRAQEGR